ncbi:MAG: enoyl-ACP reductase [Gammaproteobacteria bacterium]|nr:enoyl-ACP reductase [Gammaproteobacteria bacterium]
MQHDVQNKIYLITGIASERSIAYGIAEVLSHYGAKLILTYQNERFRERVETYGHQWNTLATIECDVQNEASLAECIRAVESLECKLNGIVHSIAYADPEQLQGRFLDAITRDGFLKAHDISAYSFCALLKAFESFLVPNESAALTLTYLGSQRALPSYNVMGLAKASLEAAVRYTAANLGPSGIRVNAISAGPIKTLAASGIKGIKSMMEQAQERSFLGRNITTREIGETAAFLLSNYSSAITGQIIYADGGYSASAL